MSADVDAAREALHGGIVYPSDKWQSQWQVGDWHCECGWFGNFGWRGYAHHLEERLAAIRAECMTEGERYEWQKDKQRCEAKLAALFRAIDALDVTDDASWPIISRRSLDTLYATRNAVGADSQGAALAATPAEEEL